MSSLLKLLSAARPAWRSANVTMQQEEVVKAAWELLKDYPIVEEALRTARQDTEHQR